MKRRKRKRRGRPAELVVLLRNPLVIKFLRF